jgi:hypothetical protein
MAMGAAVLGCSMALDSWPLSWANMSYALWWGVMFGVIGGCLTGALTWMFRAAAWWVCGTGLLSVSMASGGTLFVYASMIAAC